MLAHCPFLRGPDRHVPQRARAVALPHGSSSPPRHAAPVNSLRRLAVFHAGQFGAARCDGGGLPKVPL